MKIAIGCDHGGYDLKEDIVRFLKEKGYEVKDCGTYSKESCDYPVFGEAAARAVASGECARGIARFFAEKRGKIRLGAEKSVRKLNKKKTVHLFAHEDT